MDRRWKYFIVLNSNDFPYNIVEFEETPDGELPLCCDLNVAINFDSPEELGIRTYIINFGELRLSY